MLIMLNYYNKYILPKRLNKEMGDTSFNVTREHVVSPASGIVLEIGFGSGYNIPFYKDIKKLYALEPSNELFNYSVKKINTVDFPIMHLPSMAENIPLHDNSVDCVVSTWSMCSISDLHKALSEIRRVLKPGGTLLFVEHGQADNKIYSILQRIITPITKHFTGNCHLDRNIKQYIIDSGFSLERIDLESESGRPLMYSYEGVAINYK